MRAVFHLQCSRAAPHLLPLLQAFAKSQPVGVGLSFKSEWGEGNTRPNALETWRLQLTTSTQRANNSCWGSNDTRPTSAARAERFFEWVRAQQLYYKDLVAPDSID